eukprot:SAG31_NODE_2781_length_5095_cov_9.452162_6_plen_90_part_00
MEPIAGVQAVQTCTRTTELDHIITDSYRSAQRSAAAVQNPSMNICQSYWGARCGGADGCGRLCQTATLCRILLPIVDLLNLYNTRYSLL